MTLTASGPGTAEPGDSGKGSLWRPDWRTLVSAALIVFSFPTWNFHFLIWIALVPWFAALERTTSKRGAVIQGLWLSVFMSVGGFYWVAYVLQQFGNLPWIVAIIGLLLYSLIGQPQFYLFAAFQFLVQKRRKALRPHLAAIFSLGAALAYSGLDWLLPKLFVDTLGHCFYNAPRLRQVADIGGAPLLTMLVYYANDGIYRLWRGLRTRSEPSAWPAFQTVAPQLVAALALFIAFYAYGTKRLEYVQNRIHAPGAPVLQAGVIQANIGDFDKIAAERGVRRAAEKILSTYYLMSESALQLKDRPELLVWPETSYPSTFRTPSNSDELARDQALESFVRSHGVPLAFGGYDTFQRKDYNAFFFLAPKALPGVAGEGDLQIYRKNILLLFGEYIPGAETFRFIKDAFPQVGNFGRGSGPEVVKIETKKGTFLVNPIICYEALFPNYVLDAARKGSQLILNITNDSWFGPYGEPDLHLSLAIFRSIEARIPQLRSTNTGYSALISADGEIVKKTKLFEPEIMNVPVPLTAPIPTLMRAWGDWFAPTALALGFALLTFFLWSTSTASQGAPRPRKLN